MLIYVISDVHGCHSLFLKMLKRIHFSCNDKLFLLGDYIDRGTENLEMLQWLEKVSKTQDNIICLCGNHEIEYISYIEMMKLITKEYVQSEVEYTPEQTKGLYELTKLHCNDTFDYYQTIHELIYDKGITYHELLKWSELLRKFDYYKEVIVGKKKYILVHAGYTDSITGIDMKDHFASIEEFYLYSREDAYEKGGRCDATVIAGHSPTMIEKSFTYNAGKVFQCSSLNGKKRFFCIDCGCSYNHNMSKLACIRLDDEKVFYVSRK